MYIQVSLEVGAYRTTEGKPWILPVVKKAEKILAEKVNLIYWGGSNFEEDIFNICEGGKRGDQP